MIDINYQRELFKKELEILESAMKDLSDEKYRDNELLSKYSSLASSYDKLLNLTGRIFKISDTQGRDLKRRENEIKNILDSSNQGFLTFGESLLVNREYSQECVRIFGRKISNVSIIELLSGSNTELDELYGSVFKEVFDAEDEQKQSCLKNLPNIVKINDSFISVNYKFINHTEFDADEDMVMLVLTDITEKLKAEDQVNYLSFHDKLTSLYNRAYIDSIIPQLKSSDSLPLSIIMADMNGLKLTNDVFGHATGDRLLVNLSNIFLNCTRKSDIVARWGGDEFLILLPGANSDVCERICGRIKKACSETVPDPIGLSVSLGTATMENPETNISELFNVAENMMYSSKLVESKDIRKKIILNMEKTLHNKCWEDYEHITRVKAASVKLAKFLEEEPDSIDESNLSLLASLHDIGKAAIPKEILGKKGPLTDNEWKIMRSHTEIGFRMAQSIEEPILAQAILSLREHWNGKGYPYGLKGEQIPLISRIVSIADAFDVMTHDRPYRQKCSREEAVNELKRNSGSQFDPKLVECFIENIGDIIV